MKATKKIVGAACALVAAVALSAGSTFAWFASNGEVTATGLNVDVSTANGYLLISTSTDFSEKLTTVSLADETAVELKPSAYRTTATLANADDTCITKFANWYTGKGTAIDDGTLLEGSDTALKEFEGYVVIKDVYLSTLEGTEGIENVKLTWGTPAVSWTNKNDAISLVVLYAKAASNESVTEWTKVDVKGTSHALSVDLGGVDSESYIQVKFMVYLNGDNANVTSANAANLEGVTMNFKFEDKAAGAGTEE